MEELIKGKLITASFLFIKQETILSNAIYTLMLRWKKYIDFYNESNRNMKIYLSTFMRQQQNKAYIYWTYLTKTLTL